MPTIADSRAWLTLLLVGLLPTGAVFLLARSCPGWRWEHHPVHALVEGVGSLIALLVAVLIFLVRRAGQGTPPQFWVICALLGMGLLDAFHAGCHPGPAFVWLRSLATLVGGLLFACVWLPEGLARHPRAQKLPLVIVVLATYGGALCITFPEALPTMTNAGGFTWAARAINIAGGVGFLAAAWAFARRRSAHLWDDHLLFAHHCLLFGIAGLVFPGSVLWGANWWLWHFLRLAAYLVVLVFFFQAYRRAFQAARETALGLEKQVAERTRELSEGLEARKQAEEALARQNEELHTQRRAALSLAVDAEQARQRAERNEEALAGVNLELQREIGRRESADRQLRASKERLDLALQSARVGTWDWLIVENVITWDEYIHPLFGMKPGTFPGKYEAFLELVHPDDRDQVHGEVVSAVEEDVPYDTEFRVVWPDRTVHTIGARGKVYRDAAGRPLRMTGVCWDVSARKQAEDDLRRVAQELARSNAELEQFASIASHDLQEPLRKIQAFGDLLASTAGPALDEQARLYVERMQDAVRRMRMLIDDLLNFARVASGARSFAEVDLGRVAREVVSDLEGRLQASGGRVEIGELPQLESNPTQMRQLLQNLVGNALKFHRPDVPPVVLLRGRLLDDAASRGQTPAGPLCEITIQDNGIGVEEKYLERIFAPFQRLHGHGRYEGTGMGLAICRKIVERHGGTITARSAPGQGTTFLVLLPVRQPRGDHHHA